MKFYCAFLVALALSAAVNARSTALKDTDDFDELPSGPSSDLHNDFNEFLALVPFMDVDKLYGQYLEEDAEVQAVQKYTLTNDFRYMVRKVNSIKDVLNFYDYLQESGVAVYEYVDAMHDLLGIPHVVPGGSARSIRITGGFNGLLADIEALLPREDIEDLFIKKMKTSPAFARFEKQLHAARFQKLIDNLSDNEEFQKISKLAKEHGVHFRAIMDLILSMFNIYVPAGHDFSN